jgi:WD40 repeat protein/MinD-like ATPase involved in chromosome partitioning or flagellar assembly
MPAYTVTFYSYKGGVGRTLALANVAAALVQRGHSVFVWELDLEAPGLLNIPLFAPMREQVKGGTANLIVAPPEDFRKAVQRYTVTHPDPPWKDRLRLLPAGPLKNYSNLYQRIQWDQWFGEGRDEGAYLFQHIRNAIESFTPDIVLVDSRTGLTDIGSVCTLQLPHLVVLVFNLSHQNLAGAREIQQILLEQGRKGEFRANDLDLLRVASMVPLNESPELLQSRREAAGSRYGSSSSRAGDYHLEPDVTIPFNSRLLLEESLFVTEYPEHPLAKAYLELATKIEDKIPERPVSTRRKVRGEPGEDRRMQRGRQFEEDVAELLRLLGYQVKVNVLREGSQVDIKAVFRQGPLLDTHFVVECKDHRQSTPVDDVRSLHSRVAASAKRGALGLLVSRAGFTAEARAHAEALGVIRLATYDELVASLVDLRDYHTSLIRNYEGTRLEPLYVPPDAREEGKEEREPAWDIVADWLSQPEQPFLAMLGDYGTGKTCLSRRLAHRLARQFRDDAKARQPILIELKEVPQAFSLETVLADHFQKNNVRVDVRAVTFALEQGNFVLIIDGFDEMAIRMDWRATVENLRQILRAAAGKAKVLLTCRTEFFKDRTKEQEALRDGGGSALYQEIYGVKGRIAYLCDFSDEQVDDYVGRACGERAGEVREVIRRMPSLQEISGRPVMLDMIVTSAPQLARLGSDVTVGGLYEVYTEKWRRTNDPRLRLTREGREALVQELAFQLWQSGEPRLHHSRLSGVLRQYLKGKIQTETEFEIADQEVRTASFLTRDPEGNYGFSHRSFLEFFLAQRIVASDFDLRVKPLSEAVIGFLKDLAGVDRVFGAVERVLQAPYLAGVSENALGVAVGIGRYPERVQLAGAKLAGVNLVGASLAKASLAGADFSDASLGLADLSGADLRQANLTRAMMAGCSLVGADLEEARLAGADLDRAHCQGANFRRADLRFASMVRTELEGTDFEGANRRFCAEAGKPIGAVVVQGSQSGGVNAVTFSPDGLWLALGTQDGCVRLHDTVLGVCRRLLTEHAGAVRSVAFSPDGGTLASGSDDGSVRLWEVASGGALRTLTGHGRGVRSVAFSPDGGTLASGSDDGSVRLWDVASGRALRMLTGHEGRVLSVAFSPDGETVAAGSADGSVRLMAVASGEALRTLAGHVKGVSLVAVSQYGGTLASLIWDGSVRLLEMSSGVALRTLTGHEGWVRSVAFLPDGATMASVVSDGSVRLWEMSSGGASRTLVGREGGVSSVAVSPDGGTLASGSRDGSVRLWEVASGRALRTLAGHVKGVSSVAFSPDGGTLASGSGDGRLLLWEMLSGGALRRLTGHGGEVNSLAFSPDGSILASGSDDKRVRLWEVASGRALQTLTGHAGGVSSVAFSPDGWTLASGGDDGIVRLRDLARGWALRVLTAHHGSVRSVVFSPDGGTLASGSDDGSVRLWEVATGQCLATLYHLPDGGWAVVTPDFSFNADAIGEQYLTFVCDDMSVYWPSHVPHLRRPAAVQAVLERALPKALPTPPRARKRRK